MDVNLQMNAPANLTFETTLLVRDACLCLHAQRAAQLPQRQPALLNDPLARPIERRDNSRPSPEIEAIEPASLCMKRLSYKDRLARLAGQD